ncbi:MAG: hypothetical protein PWR22_747 [Moorella sp. (in: firmicutes)]|nr:MULTISPECIES: DUF5665 domain-containing protein [unclassified Moorella (in: firmicutes)]MDK2816118.1 hypothetical protein [Moorella sp. (in: firmicutes)]MDK2895157.1 hypothetical protein [Moorella sp. (in: firmicutes)]GEA15043.1 hypothetical protein E308F_12870 [Moorella sp. E308F]GEA17058.1 hypothetical protein E306M_01920 [Moorella sp. E306M]
MVDNEKTAVFLAEKMQQLITAIEKASIAEWIELYRRPWRLLYLNFAAGVARGLGIAVGFAILGAIVIYIIRELALLNLPVIGKLIAEIVRMVQQEVY